ncbi:anoctamin-8-like isoform X2 [Anneissia japonica]|uniref:anoctamin-8-like isoform X2 n=1 Tax=Anneissia japonica TaxID=1529436 RepID=UPI00142586FB|nr:anoctamin-8-like isoform X2 [Anneissia japonica]
MDRTTTIGSHFTAVKVAAKIFGKKFAKTSKFVYANRLWMHTIPTRDCDVLIAFPEKTQDDTLMWLLSRLRARTPEIIVQVRHHGNTGVHGFYLSSNYENLLKGAENLALRKPIKEEYGGGLKEFTCAEQGIFDGVDNQAEFLRSQERQAIVMNMLQNLRAGENESLGKITFHDGQPIVSVLLSKGIISQVFPLHNNDNLARLRQTWVQAVFKKQPLDEINDYFGVKIAMYFAWLGRYTTALMLPAILGTFLWITQGIDEANHDEHIVIFSVFNIIWGTLYLESWKRRSAELAYQWGTLDSKHELITDPRPLYTGDLIESPISGKLTPYYPAWKRNLFHYFVTLPVIILCIIVVFLSMLSLFELQEYVNKKIQEEQFPSWISLLPKVLLGICINITEDVYKKIAKWLNDMENYRLQETYENHLIIKLVVVQFINNFLSLFYVAFYLQDMARLRATLATLFITKQIIGNAKEAMLPYLMEKIKMYRMTYKMAEENIDLDDDSDDNENVLNEEEHSELLNARKKSASHRLSKDESKLFTLTQAEVESCMHPYEDTFDDYLEMFIQFGYVILFSSAFPLAGLCALINNVVEIRTDAFKLCTSLQRPFGQRVENIGTWQDAMELMGVIGVIVNFGLLGISGQIQRAFPGSSTSTVIIFIVVLEHVTLACKFAIAYAIPDIPHWVSLQMAKLEFNRREALKKLDQAAMASAKESIEKATKNEAEGTCDPLGRELKKPEPGKVWPTAMAQTAANFKLYDSLGPMDEVCHLVECVPETKPIEEKKNE